MKNRLAFTDILFYSSIILSVLTILAVFANFNDYCFRNFFNSDTLYLPSIYKDIFIDHNSFKGWHLNPSPNIFPDMLVYFVIMAVTQNFITASFMFAIIQYLFFLYLILRLFKAINLPDAKLIATLSNLLLLLFFMVALYSNDFVFTFFLISNAYHTGAFLMSLLCTLLAFEYLKDNKLRSLILISIISMLCVLSDRLFIVLYILPWLMLLVFYFKFEHRRRLLILTIVNIGGLLAGYILFYHLDKSNYIFIGKPARMFEFKYITDSYRILLDQMHIYLIDLNYKSLILVLSIITLIGLIIMSVKKLWKQILSNTDTFLIFGVIFSITVFIAPVVNGNYTAFDTIRYNIYSFYLLIISLGIILYFLIQNLKSYSTKVFNVVIIILMFWVSVNTIKKLNANGLTSYFNYYPDLVKRVDDISKHEKLLCGLGDYWKAKKITMFSKQDVRVYTALNGLDLWDHVMNENWYKEGRFNFIISDNESQDTLINNYFNNDTRLIIVDDLRLIITPEFYINTKTNKIELLPK